MEWWDFNNIKNWLAELLFIRNVHLLYLVSYYKCGRDSNRKLIALLKDICKHPCILWKIQQSNIIIIKLN